MNHWTATLTQTWNSIKQVLSYSNTTTTTSTLAVHHSDDDTIHTAQLKDQLYEHHASTCDCQSNSPSHINTLYYQPTPLNLYIIQKSPSLQSFCPPSFLNNGH